MNVISPFKIYIMMERACIHDRKDSVECYSLILDIENGQKGMWTCFSMVYWFSYFNSILIKTFLHLKFLYGTFASQWRHNDREVSQITGVSVVYSTVFFSGSDQRNYLRSASLAFVWGIHRRPMNSPNKGPLTREICPYDNVIRQIVIHLGHQLK